MNQFFSAKGIKNEHKKTAYEGLELGILLPAVGCKLSCLPKSQLNCLNRLQIFHDSIVRAICRVTMWHVGEHIITQLSLERRMQLKPFQYYRVR